jgi:hypothetical protein
MVYQALLLEVKGFSDLVIFVTPPQSRNSIRTNKVKAELIKVDFHSLFSSSFSLDHGVVLPLGGLG